MPTTSEILTLAPASSYLAANGLAKGVLFPNNKINPLLPQQIYAVYFILNKIHSIDANYPGLEPCANYLWELMGAWGRRAQGISGSGGNVPSPNPVNNNIYPFVITSANFESDGVSYNNPDIVGDNIMLFINEFSQQWLVAGAGYFIYTATGIRITIPGFDANTQSYTIIIQEVFGNGVTPPVTTNDLLINDTDSLLINSIDSLLIS